MNAPIPDHQLQIRPTTDDFAFWRGQFVPEIGFWVLDDTASVSATAGARMLPRNEWRTDAVTSAISFINAYHLWAIAKVGTRAVMAEQAWLDSLTPAEGGALRASQVRLGRGLCVPRDRFPGSCPPIDDAIVADRVVLDRAIWDRLAPEVQDHVLRAELPDWDDDDAWPVPPDAPAHVAAIANRFLHMDGINCFATAIYGTTGNDQDLYGWMQTGTLTARMADLGYALTDDATPRHGDIVVFRQEDEPVHAAYALGADRFLNKSGQASFNPVRVIDWQTLRAEWEEQSVAIYRRDND